MVVPASLLDEAERLYAPPEDPVFQLVPPPFEERVHGLYAGIGRPPVSSSSFWVVYLQLLQAFRALGNAELTPILESHQETQRIANDGVPLLSGLRELRNGDNVVGPYGEPGFPNHTRAESGVSESVLEYADFTDQESSSDEE